MADKLGISSTACLEANGPMPVMYNELAPHLIDDEVGEVPAIVVEL